MVGYSVIVPHSGRLQATLSLAESLRSVLSSLANPFEIFIVATPGTRHECQDLRQAIGDDPGIDIVRLVAADGVDAAVFATLELCRFETVVAIDPAGGFSALDIPRLLERLARYDMVVARRRIAGWPRQIERLQRMLIPLSAAWHASGHIFWAAHREALPSTLPIGAMRRLSVITARRGFRVGEICVATVCDQAPVSRTRTRLRDLLAAWWLAGREHRAHCEQIREIADCGHRVDGAHSHHPHMTTHPLRVRFPSAEQR